MAFLFMLYSIITCYKYESAFTFCFIFSLTFADKPAHCALLPFCSNPCNWKGAIIRFLILYHLFEATIRQKSVAYTFSCKPWFAFFYFSSGFLGKMELWKPNWFTCQPTSRHLLKVNEPWLESFCVCFSLVPTHWFFLFI